jgi:hypothetical protein
MLQVLLDSVTMDVEAVTNAQGHEREGRWLRPVTVDVIHTQDDIQTLPVIPLDGIAVNEILDADMKVNTYTYTHTHTKTHTHTHTHTRTHTHTHTLTHSQTRRRMKRMQARRWMRFVHTTTRARAHLTSTHTRTHTHTRMCRKCQLALRSAMELACHLV